MNHLAIVAVEAVAAPILVIAVIKVCLMWKCHRPAVVVKNLVSLPTSLTHRI